MRPDVGGECLLGCRSRRTGAPLRTRPPRVVCDRDVEQVRGWLEDIPNLWMELRTVVARGSVQVEGSEAKPTKGSHAPMPIRPEVVSLLDLAGDESVSLLLFRWTQWVAAHRAPGSRARSSLPDVSVLLTHLDWLATRPEIASLHRELRTTVRRMRYALGQRPPSAVGICGAEVDGQQCGGPLLPLKLDVGVYCGWCGDEWHEGDLRGLGRLLTQRWVPVQVAAYLASRPESTIRDWVAGLVLPSLCDLGSRQLLVDAVALAPLAESKRSRKRTRGGDLASLRVT